MLLRLHLIGTVAIYMTSKSMKVMVYILFIIFKSPGARGSVLCLRGNIKKGPDASDPLRRGPKTSAVTQV